MYFRYTNLPSYEFHNTHHVQLETYKICYDAGVAIYFPIGHDMCYGTRALVVIAPYENNTLTQYYGDCKLHNLQ